MSVDTYRSRREKAFNPATKRLVEYGLIGLAIATVFIASVQERPQEVFPSQGTLQLGITDGVPIVDSSNSYSSRTCHGDCEATSLNVTVSSIEIHTSGIGNVTGDWTPACTNQVPMTFDVVRLHNTTRIICSEKVQPETITNIRLYVLAANSTLVDGSHVKLTLPSGKLEIPTSPLVEVQAGKTTMIVVDFQPHIVCPGNGDMSCKLTPALHAVPEGPS